MGEKKQYVWSVVDQPGKKDQRSKRFATDERRYLKNFTISLDSFGLKPKAPEIVGTCMDIEKYSHYHEEKY